LNKNRENEVFVNPSLCRPSALRSMLPILLSRTARSSAATRMLYTYNLSREIRKTH
jgi:hypothetical protein